MKKLEFSNNNLLSQKKSGEIKPILNKSQKKKKNSKKPKEKKCSGLKELLEQIQQEKLKKARKDKVKQQIQKKSETEAQKTSINSTAKKIENKYIKFINNMKNNINKKQNISFKNIYRLDKKIWRIFYIKPFPSGNIAISGDDNEEQNYSIFIYDKNFNFMTKIINDNKLIKLYVKNNSIFASI